jgi:hypothetical protein
MTARLYVPTTHVASVAHDHRSPGVEANRTVDVAHAVARPAVDGLESSVCGVLVSAIAELGWDAVPEAQKCEECRRIAG